MLFYTYFMHGIFRWRIWKNQTYRKRKQKQGRVLQNDYPTTVHPHATKKEATEKTFKSNTSLWCSTKEPS